MTCKLNGLFSLGEDFDDEDLLGTDWTACSASATAAVSSGSLRASSAAHREPEKVCHQQTGGSSSSQHNGLASLRSTHTDAAQTVSAGLRQLSHAAQTRSTPPPALIHPGTNLAAGQSRASTKDLLKPGVAEDEFDDWDVDLADLDECDSRMGQPPKSAATVEPLFSAKTQQCSTSGGGQTTPNRMLRGFSTACKTSGSSGYAAASRNLSVGRWQSPNQCMSSPSAPPRSPSVFPGLTATSPAHSSLSRTLRTPQQQQRPRVTPHASPQSRCIFETVSPGSSSVGSSALSPHPLHAPFLTNRLVQLVSASNKLPKKRPRSEAQHPRTRRFPGPAGLLPQQPQTQNLDQIVVSVPQTPAHGVVARLPSQGSCSQPEEDEFGAGGWAAMKAEMGLDERNPSCFLHTYSVVMVLRKAALKQLTRNKVPNMAVLLKSIVHTHADAKAVFKDPTGEIQGTVHRRLLDDRADELKVGAVLLLKQVGVFSPSHRNHYLNVTPNNLLGIYAPDGVRLASSQLPALVLDPMSLSAAPAPAGPQEPVSQMQLLFDEEDDDGREVERRMERDGYPAAQTHTENEKSTDTSRGFQETGRNPSPQEAAWDADDDLDELLGEMSEDTYSL